MFAALKTRRLIFLFLFFFFAASPSFSLAQTSGGLVVSDSVLAAKAGMEILKAGGNAIDAAVATAFALGVLDQAASGIGGGGFMVIYQSKAKKAHALDFRETAPAASRRELYLKGGKPDPRLSLAGALAVAVPGEVAGLAEALKRFGTKPLPEVMAPSIRYASEGFPLGPRLRRSIERQLQNLRKSPELARVMLAKDEIPPEGEKIVQPELGETLRAIADQGPQVFYQGWIAEAIVDQLKKEGGVMTLEDLKGYKPVWREPLVGRYRKWLVVTMPPPSSGGIALIEMLNVLEKYQLGRMPHDSAAYFHLLAEAMKHAFADRAQYLGDPDFVQMPVEKLLSKEYASSVRGRISPAKTFPPNYYGLAALKVEKGGTTHFGVLDRFGNAVSCSLTINTQFGSKILVPKTGVVLNNEMDDFSIHPGVGNVYGLLGADANSLQSRKRPLSSMTPAIVLEGDRPALIAGGSGGPRIISATLQTVLNVLDFHMPVKKAVESPRIHHQWMPDELVVENKISANARKSLEKMGHKVQERAGLGLVQAIEVRRSKASGAADPRREESTKEEKAVK